MRRYSIPTLGHRIRKTGLSLSAALAMSCCTALPATAQQEQRRGINFTPLAKPGSMKNLEMGKMYGSSYAIIIGISRYHDSNKNLEYADADAKSLRDLLITSYDFPAEHVTLLLNEKATKANIEHALSQLANGTKIKEGDRVLVYFSGHGQTVPVRSGERGFLIPYDADVDLVHPDNLSGYMYSCLNMNSIWESLSACSARHVLLIADACYGGLLVKPRAFVPEPPSERLLKNLLTRPALEALTAGGAGEAVIEDPAWGHGALTYKLLEELKAQASSPGVPFLASELAAYLKVSVANITGGRQLPQFGSHDYTEGDFIFYATGPNKETNAFLTSIPSRPVASSKILVEVPEQEIISPLLQRDSSATASHVTFINTNQSLTSKQDGPAVDYDSSGIDRIVEKSKPAFGLNPLHGAGVSLAATGSPAALRVPIPTPVPPSTIPKRRTSGASYATPKRPLIPKTLKDSSFNATVTIEVVFGADGQCRATIFKRAGLGLEALNDAALAACSHMKFKPAYQDGSPVDDKHHFTFNFKQ